MHTAEEYDGLWLVQCNYAENGMVAFIRLLTFSIAASVAITNGGLTSYAQDDTPPAEKGPLTVEKDIAYADGGDQQKLDLYLPESKRGFATIVFTYGGGWHTGSRKSVTPIGEKFQSLGFGCAY